MAKVVILGMNRCGTKLASYIVTETFGFNSVFLEPFTWDRGIDASASKPWQEQQELRKRSPQGRQEHTALDILSNGKEQSPWLNSLLCKQDWDIIKFIEIGRYKLYHAICSDVFYVSLIRHPLQFIQSVKGTGIQKEAIIEQWQRLHLQQQMTDPLPDADKYLAGGLADCARAYVCLYQELAKFQPEHGVKTSYNDLISEQTFLAPLSEYFGVDTPAKQHAPLLGTSTKKILTDTEESYISANLVQTYNNFLTRNG